MIVTIPTTVILGLVAWRLRPRPMARGIAAAEPVAWRSRRRMLVVGAVTALLATLISPVVAVVMVAVALLSKRWSAARRRFRTKRQVASDFPDALDVLVLSIRAGYLPAQAVVEIGPFLTLTVRDAFESVASRMSEGKRFADALTCLSAELGPIAQPLVDSLSAADRYGLPLAPVLERLSLEARQQRRRDSDAVARELPVRLAVPLVVCTLPSFVLLAIVPLLLGALSSLHT